MRHAGRRRLALLVIVLAPLLHVAAFVLMLFRVPPFHSLFYSLAWWTYIPLVAACNHFSQGNSLLFDDPKEFRKIAILSVPVWSFFELCNFRLENWFYIGVPTEWWVRFPGYFAAFGSVLPGLFETRTFLANAGLGRVLKHRPPHGPGRPGGWLAGAGAVFSGAALLWPDLFFPLIWVGPIFCLDWLLSRSRRSNESLIAGPAAGNHYMLVQLFVSGLVCGFLWEFWNFWAGSKWIYSLPYLNGVQVFEMPLAGFLGFPPFAVECWLAYRLARSSRVWRDQTGFFRVLVGVLYVLFCVGVFRGIEAWTVLDTNPLWG